jgi:hypothetical protein
VRGLPSGIYPDPLDPDFQRYWDGERWGDRLHPPSESPDVPRADDPRQGWGGHEAASALPRGAICVLEETAESFARRRKVRTKQVPTRIVAYYDRMTITTRAGQRIKGVYRRYGLARGLVLDGRGVLAVRAASGWRPLEELRGDETEWGALSEGVRRIVPNGEAAKILNTALRLPG